MIIQNLHATLWPIKQEQASLWTYVETEHASLSDLVQERHDELHGMIAS